MATRIMRLNEIEGRTGIPVNTLRHMRHRGDDIPLWLLAGRVVAYEDELETWLAEQRTKTSTTKIGS